MLWQRAVGWQLVKNDIVGEKCRQCMRVQGSSRYEMQFMAGMLELIVVVLLVSRLDKEWGLWAR